MLKFKLLSIVLLSLLIILPLQAQEEVVIDTVAGTRMEAGYNGDSIPATYSMLYTPMAVCVDEFDRIYVADTQNNRIRIIENKIIDTVAGNGVFGYNGDEKKGTKCSFAFPMGVHVRTANQEKKTVEIYICDTRNNRVRVVNEYGIMRTIAGSGRFGFSGDNGPSEKGDLKWPSSVSLDNDGNIYIADTYNHRIRVVYMGGSIAGDANKKIIPNPKKLHLYTLAGTGKGGYGGDGGQADKANLKTPWDMYAAGGELFISDKGNHIIRKISADGIISTVAGRPGVGGYYGDILKATEEKVNTPFGLWADENNVYVADAMNSRIRKVDYKADAISTYVGNGEFGFSGDGAPANMAMLSHPIDIFGDGKGKFYLCDLQNSIIRVIKAPETGAATQ